MNPIWKFPSPTANTPAGATVQCAECGRPITLPRAVTAAEHALSAWTCKTCLDRSLPGHDKE